MTGRLRRGRKRAMNRRIFVQHRGTKHFVAEADDWTRDVNSARDFETSLNALAYCVQRDLLEAQIVVRSTEPGQEDVVVPVHG